MIRRTIWIIVTSGVYKKPSVLFSRYIPTYIKLKRSTLPSKSILSLNDAHCTQNIV